MKPIHKVAGTDTTRPEFMYIRVKDGRVGATNTHILIDFAVKKVFGLDLIAADEELYFNAAEWGASNMNKADVLTREGLHFKASLKGVTIGVCKALTCGEFCSATGRRPVNLSQCYPTTAKPIERIGMNPKLLADVIAAFGKKENQFSFRFTSPTSPVYIQHADFDGFALLFPLMLKTEAFGKLPCDPLERIETPSAETPIEDLL